MDILKEEVCTIIKHNKQLRRLLANEMGLGESAIYIQVANFKGKSIANSKHGIRFLTKYLKMKESDICEKI